MSLTIGALTADARDPQLVARFWAALLGRTAEPAGDHAYRLPPTRPTQFAIRFHRNEAQKSGPNWMHPDLTSTSPDDQRAKVALALAHGGTHLDVGQLPNETHVVLADPEGNELCVLPADNDFTTGTDTIGCLACDGSRAAGLFWSAALDWPLVWDEGEETAIQSPGGGSKISWDGAPPRRQEGKNRLHLDLLPSPDSDAPREIERLIGLGASRSPLTSDQMPWTVLLDPDGNEFCVHVRSGAGDESPS